MNNIIRHLGPNYFDEYDFVIVGSGPGGCVLANRLTENANWNVLLIEAGNVETFIQNIPLAAAKSRLTQFDWAYKSEPQLDACLGGCDEFFSDNSIFTRCLLLFLFFLGMNGRRCALARGRGLGGSSVIDYMLYSRGHEKDFERWAADGNNGWSFKDVLPYFLKSERSTLHYQRNVSHLHHNTGGDLNVEFNRFRTKIAESFVEANQFLGQREIDYNSGDNLGVSYAQSNTLNGMRHSAYRAFIEPILQRKNLHIMLDSRVTKVIIDPSSKSTKGVEIVRNRKRRRVNIRKEVILAAGAFHSPQLLLLSGIGMKNDLKKHGIKAIHELPVGKMMTDHLCHFGVTFVLNTTGNSLSSNDFLNPIHLLNYLSGYGPLSTNGVGEAISYIRTPFATHPGPDIEILSAAGSLHWDGNYNFRTLNIKEAIFENVYKPLLVNHVDTFTALIILLHPKSTGFMELKNGNAFSAPLFYPNYLEHQDDVEAMLQGVKYVVKLLQTPQFQKLGARLNPIPLPICAHIEFGSDDYWRCSIRTLSSSFHDQVGTCKMGAINDYDSTVSPELKVDGISYLRVADASVIPVSMSGHMNAISCMIGEKAADLIKNEWKKVDAGDVAGTFEVSTNFGSVEAGQESTEGFLSSSERSSTTRTTSQQFSSTTQSVFASTQNVFDSTQNIFGKQSTTTESYYFDLFDTNSDDDGSENLAPTSEKATTKGFTKYSTTRPTTTTRFTTIPKPLQTNTKSTTESSFLDSFDVDSNEDDGIDKFLLSNGEKSTTTTRFTTTEKTLQTNTKTTTESSFLDTFDADSNEEDGIGEFLLPNGEKSTTTTTRTPEKVDATSDYDDFDSIENFLVTDDPIERTTKKTEVTSEKTIENEKVETTESEKVETTTVAPQGNDRVSLEDDLIKLLQNNLLTANLGGGGMVDPDAIKYPDEKVNGTEKVDEAQLGELTEDDIRRRRRFIRF